MFFIDANVFLEIELKDEKSKECAELLSCIHENNVPAATSDFIVYTCLLQIEHKGSVEKMRNFMLFMDNMDSIQIHSPSYAVMFKTFEIMERQGLDFDDSLIVAIMKSLDIMQLVSFDRHFDKIKEIKRIEPRNILNFLQKEKAEK